MKTAEQKAKDYADKVLVKYEGCRWFDMGEIREVVEKTYIAGHLEGYKAGSDDAHELFTRYRCHDCKNLPF